MSILRKLFAGVTLCSMLFTVGGSASALTMEELTAQIAQLQAQLLAYQQQLSQLQGASGTTTGGYAGVPAGFTFQKQLSLGSRNDDVVYLKTILKAEVPASATWTVGNNYFGPLTRAAVIAFQKKYGISAVGTVGPITRAKLNALLATGTTPPAEPPVAPPPATTPMTVTLAADTPAAANLWQGSANNIVAKFVFNGGATATSVTGLTLRSYGTTAASGTTDIAAVKVFDENGIQLGSDRQVAGNLVNFVFVPAISIPANGSRTISVAVNVGATAQVMASVKFGIEAATSISGATFSGNFPVSGNSFTIVPAGSTGSLSVAQYSTLPKTSVKIGEKDIILEGFTVSAGSNEDVDLTQIVVKIDTAATTISDSDVTNVRIREIGGAVIAGPLNFTNKRATFNLAAPVRLTKGAAKNYEVIADIVAGNGRAVAAYIGTGGVIARGVSSTISLVSAGSTTANAITIGTGTLVVSMDASHPQGADALMIKTVNRKNLAAFNVRAQGEAVILNTIQMKFDGTPNVSSTYYVGSVGLYDGDALVSNLTNVTGNLSDVDFSLNWTIPANTSKVLLVKGINNNLDTSGGSATLETVWSGYTGYGLSSGETLTSTADVTSTAVTVYATGDLTMAADTAKTPYSQGIRNPINNATLAALRVYAMRENQKLKQLIITPSATGKLSSLTIYADDGVTQLSVPVAESGSGVYTFTASELLNDIIFYQNQYKTLLLKGNVSGTQANFVLSIANTSGHLTTTGLDSGTDVAKQNLSFAITSPYAGGTFHLNPKIVEIKKDATSPSGSISRGTQTVTGVWTLTNADATAADAVITSIKFTSKTGLPSGIVLTDGDDDELLFKLYDGDGNLVASGKTEVDLDTGVVTFAKAAMVTLTPGAPKQLRLVIDTTNTAKWPSNTQLHWTVAAVGDVTVTSGYVGFGGTTWSIPADTNIVTLP